MVAEWKTRFGAIEGSLEDARRVTREEYEKARRDVLQGAVDTPTPVVPGVKDADPLDLAVSIEIDHIVDHVARRRGIDVYRGDRLPADLQARIDGLNDGRLQRAGLRTAKQVQYEPPFSELGERWLEQWRQRPGRRPANTSAQYTATISLFAEWWGERPIRLIERSDAARFVEEVLKRLPPSWARTGNAPRPPLKALLAADGGGGLSTATINRHVGTLKAIWSWARKLGYAEGENPFGELREKLTKRNTRGYVAWEIEELQCLFNPPPRRRDVYELTLVGMYSAMRINEIASLTWADLGQGEDGIWHFRVREAKTAAGERVVPVHSRPREGCGTDLAAIQPRGSRAQAGRGRLAPVRRPQARPRLPRPAQVLPLVPEECHAYHGERRRAAEPVGADHRPRAGLHLRHIQSPRAEPRAHEGYHRAHPLRRHHLSGARRVTAGVRGNPLQHADHCHVTAFVTPPRTPRGPRECPAPSGCPARHR